MHCPDARANVVGIIDLSGVRACVALGGCRQRIVATINKILSYLVFISQYLHILYITNMWAALNVKGSI